MYCRKNSARLNRLQSHNGTALGCSLLRLLGRRWSLVRAQGICIDLWYLRGALFSLEVRFFLEAEQFCRDHSGKARARGVVVLHPFVVILARYRDAILGSRYLILCLQKILVRLQLRILLLQNQQAANRAAKTV